MNRLQNFQDVVEGIEHNRVHRSYEIYKRQLDLTIDRKTASPLLFCGGKPGLGKTHAVMTACAKRDIKIFPSRPASPSAFVEMLADASFLNTKVIVLDDVGSLLTSPQTTELIKMGWDKSGHVVWSYKNKKWDFKLKSALIWISNANLTKDVAPEMQRNLAALQSRGGPQIWIEGSDQELFNYTIWLGTVGGMLKSTFASIAAQEIAVNFFNTHRNRLQEISPRTLFNMARGIHKGSLNEDLATYLTDKEARDISGFGQLQLVLSATVGSNGAGRFGWQAEGLIKEIMPAAPTTSTLQ